MWPTKSSKNNFFAAHAIVNRQHDDVQNERSLGTNLSQLNENENGWKKGVTLLKNDFLKKLDKQINKLPTRKYNYLQCYFVLKTLKVAKKPVAVLVEDGRSMGMNLSQLDEKGNGREKKGGLNPL